MLSFLGLWVYQRLEGADGFSKIVVFVLTKRHTGVGSFNIGHVPWCSVKSLAVFAGASYRRLLDYSSITHPSCGTTSTGSLRSAASRQKDRPIRSQTNGRAVGT